MTTCTDGFGARKASGTVRYDLPAGAGPTGSEVDCSDRVPGGTVPEGSHWRSAETGAVAKWEQWPSTN